MDVDKNTQIPSRFIVTSIPTLIIFKDGKMVKRLVGFRGQAELEEEVQKFR
jgi:thioredoxin 1